MALVIARSAIPAQFEAFRAELDEHHDRRERLIKASRDVTIASKRVIFFLHRAAGAADIDETRSTAYPSGFVDAGRQGLAKLKEVQGLFRGIAGDVSGGQYWRYSGAVSGGLQEYVEAYSFAWFLCEGTLVSRERVEASLCGEGGQRGIWLSVEDYLLGVSDVTGEVMRLAITCVPRRDGERLAGAMGTFVRECKAAFDPFVPFVSALGKKQDVTAASLVKIEHAAYEIKVRASEYL